MSLTTDKLLRAIDTRIDERITSRGVPHLGKVLSVSSTELEIKMLDVYSGDADNPNVILKYSEGFFLTPTLATFAVDEFVLLQPVGRKFLVQRIANVADNFVPKLDTVIAKTADETVNNSNVLQNDNHFLFTAKANTIYLVDMILLFNNPGVQVSKYFWSLPSGTANGLSYIEDVIGQYVNVSRNFTSAGKDMLSGTWTLQIGITAGPVNFQWAQSVAEVVNLDMLTGSIMRVREV